MQRVKIGGLEVSRFILGSNPFSGFSHQGHDLDNEMFHYWTCARIKETMRQAEALGVNTIIARADHHIIRVLTEHWDEGGTIQWFGQTCPELGESKRILAKMKHRGAVAAHIHGGYVDHLWLNGRIEEVIADVARARELGLPVGIAGHRTEVIRWAEENLDVDYYMCSYYNPIPRKEAPDHRSGTRELYLEEDRRAMTELIQELSKPAIHYKIMAAGRNDPQEAFDYVARHLRPGDAVCVGIFTKDKPDMLRQDVELFEKALA